MALDVHGVTGSSPVLSTILKSLESSMGSRLFVILTKQKLQFLLSSIEKLKKVRKTALRRTHAQGRFLFTRF